MNRRARIARKRESALIVNGRPNALMIMDSAPFVRSMQSHASIVEGVAFAKMEMDVAVSVISSRHTTGGNRFFGCTCMEK